MRKIIASEMISVDGFFAGPDGNIDWHMVNDEFNQYAIKLLSEIDTLLFGRVTYQMFESYWPAAVKDPSTSKDDVVIGKAINDVKKIVFSKTIKAVEWNNSELKSEIDPVEIKAMKKQVGKDIVIYGSGTIVTALSKLGLIDEYRLFVAPVVLGEGKPLFSKTGVQKLKLVDTISLSNGVAILTYQQAQ